MSSLLAFSPDDASSGGAGHRLRWARRGRVVPRRDPVRHAGRLPTIQGRDDEQNIRCDAGDGEKTESDLDVLLPSVYHGGGALIESQTLSVCLLLPRHALERREFRQSFEVAAPLSVYSSLWFSVF